MWSEAITEVERGRRPILDWNQPPATGLMMMKSETKTFWPSLKDHSKLAVLWNWSALFSATSSIVRFAPSYYIYVQYKCYRMRISPSVNCIVHSLVNYCMVQTGSKFYMDLESFLNCVHQLCLYHCLFVAVSVCEKNCKSFPCRIFLFGRNKQKTLVEIHYYGCLRAVVGKSIMQSIFLKSAFMSSSVLGV